MTGFSRDRRIRRRADFLRIQSGGKRLTTPHYVFLVADGEGPSRLGLVVSKKVGNAVARNRVKRVCRECFRRLDPPDGHDLVVIARAGADALGLEAALAEWKKVAARLVRT